MKKVLILEDDPIRTKQFQRNLIGNLVVVVATSKRAIELLNHPDHPWDVLFLDHDLGGKVMQESGENTGYEVACWLEEHPERQPKIIGVHSFNPAGREKMLQALPNAYSTVGIWDDRESLQHFVEREV